MSTEFIIKILEQIREFERSDYAKNNPEVEDFRRWLNDEKYRNEGPTKLFSENDKNVSFLENEICKHILLISRYAKVSVRRGLQEFPELANEEFTYLYRIMDEPGMSKMALIDKNAHEKPTGTHIIKRLVDYGLVEEKGDKADKRIKLLFITKKGIKFFNNSVPVVDEISRFLSGDLSVQEKELLLNILVKLNTFHDTQFKRVK